MLYSVKTKNGSLIQTVENDSYLKLLEFLSSEFKNIKPIFSKNQTFNFGDYTANDKFNNRQVIITLN